VKNSTFRLLRESHRAFLANSPFFAATVAMPVQTRRPAASVFSVQRDAGQLLEMGLSLFRLDIPPTPIHSLQLCVNRRVFEWL
jgi:hypothetical protein